MKKRSYITILVIAAMICLLPTTVLSAKATLNDSNLPLKGKTISIMGDSISTYTGWSDVDPIINDPGTTVCGRTGEAYYGPSGGDFHNTDMLVTDTWWHQAATQLGAEVLMSNASNSTGLFYASYSYNKDWEDYLKARLMYKDRPYYLGKDGKSPDIIALYVGSNEVRNNSLISDLGSVDAVDFDTLIVKNADGTYTYAEPATVAEACCILLHKVSVTYPDAEVYCFKVVPGAGGTLSTINGKGRLPYAKAFNEMVDDVAEHYDAITVDLLTAFELDPDNDGVATQEDFDKFQTYYNNDPHPNAAGFDVITECFVNAVIDNSKYIASVKTGADSSEPIGLDVKKNGNEITRTAKDYITGNGLIVDYDSIFKANGDASTFEEKYTSENSDGTYKAEGGYTEEVITAAPLVTVELPLIPKKDDAEPVTKDAKGREKGPLGTTGDDDTSDGIYNYTKENIIRQGIAAITAMPIEVKERTSRVNFEDPDYIKGTVTPTEDNDLMKATLNVPENLEIPENYDYQFIGSDTFSKFYSAHAHHDRSANYPDEPPAYKDSNRTLYVQAAHSIFTSRNLVVPKMFFKEGVVEEGGPFLARWDSVQQFILSDNDGNLITGYCADKNTPAEDGYNYKLYNLEDATYYSEAEAKMIRAIAHNGYWGTESGFGSLASVKELMENAPDGTFTEDDIKNITDGMALTATQYAIWTYSNVMNKIEFLNCYYGKSNLSSVGPPADQDEVELVFKLYHYLTSLEPAASLQMKTTKKMVINENNFLEGVSVEIKSKPESDPNNKDDDTTNDVYLTNLKFKLGVKPNAGDDLVLQITSDGEPVATGRITGTPDPKEKAAEVQLTADDDGYYTFEDVVLQEGVNDDLCFYLGGTQELEKAAQLLLSEIKEVNGEMTPSQPMVVVMSGSRDVNVRMDINFELNVDDEQVSVEHAWRTEQTFDPEDQATESPETPAGPEDQTTEPSETPAGPEGQTTEPPADDTDKSSPEDAIDDAYDTGDHTNLFLWFAILIASISIFIATIFRNRFTAK